MARLDVEEYRRNYLKAVEERLMAKRDKIPHFTTQALHEALMAELNRADEGTWEVEVPDNREQALREAEERMMESLKKNVDLGTGKSY